MRGANDSSRNERCKLTHYLAENLGSSLAQHADIQADDLNLLLVHELPIRECGFASRQTVNDDSTSHSPCRPQARLERGAANALEAVTCVETLLTGLYPPTINYEEPDPECDVDVVANQPRKGKADIVLNNSLAFGGYDAVVCFARPGVLAGNGGSRS